MIYTEQFPHIINPQGHPVTTPTVSPLATIELDLNQLRLVGKSVSRTLDSITKQLDRMSSGHQRDEVKRDWLVYDEIDVEIRSAITLLVTAS